MVVRRPRRAYEALALGDNKGLTALQGWLKTPGSGAAALHLGIADLLAADKDGAAFAFGQEMLGDWIAQEARDAAMCVQLIETAYASARADGRELAIGGPAAVVKAG